MNIKENVVRIMRSHLKAGNSFRDAVHYAWQLFGLQGDLTHIDIIDMWKSRDVETKKVVKKSECTFLSFKCLFQCGACADQTCTRRTHEEK